MMKAYVLIETEKGKTNEVVKAIRKLKGILSVDAVTNPYDAIAIVMGDTLSDVGSIVTVDFGRIAGICRTVTCAQLVYS